MNSYYCLQWIREYGFTEMDYITTEHAVRWICDLAMESAYSDDDFSLIERARRFHASVLNRADQLDMFKV